MLTKEELDVIELTRILWRAVSDLAECNPAEKREIALHLHAIQHAIMARSAVRSHPDVFDHSEDFQ